MRWVRPPFPPCTTSLPNLLPQRICVGDMSLAWRSQQGKKKFVHSADRLSAELARTTRAMNMSSAQRAQAQIPEEAADSHGVPAVRPRCGTRRVAGGGQHAANTRSTWRSSGTCLRKRTRTTQLQLIMTGALAERTPHCTRSISKS